MAFLQDPFARPFAPAHFDDDDELQPTSPLPSGSERNIDIFVKTVNLSWSTFYFKHMKKSLSGMNLNVAVGFLRENILQYSNLKMSKPIPEP